MNEGAQAIVGGNRYGDKGYFVEPTVLVNTTQHMKVVQEEIFDPWSARNRLPILKRCWKRPITAFSG